MIEEGSEPTLTPDVVTAFRALDDSSGAFDTRCRIDEESGKDMSQDIRTPTPPHREGGSATPDRRARSRCATVQATLYSIGTRHLYDADGNVLQMNRVAEALTGWSEVEAQGRRPPSVQIINEETAEVRALSPRLREGVVSGSRTTRCSLPGWNRTPIATAAHPSAMRR